MRDLGEMISISSEKQTSEPSTAKKDGKNRGIMSMLVPCVCVYLVAQLCLTLCDPKDCSLPRSSIHGIFQARIRVEGVAICFSRGSS